MIIKKLFIWLIILLLSTGLIITSFITNPSKNSNDNTIKISNKTINNSDIKNITEIIKSKNEYLEKINDIDSILKKMILNNIKANILSKKNGLTITKKELKNRILNIDAFKINEKFSEKLYIDFLTKNKLTEFQFQQDILKKSEKAQINNGIKLIKDTYAKKFKIKHLNIKKRQNINSTNKESYKKKLTIDKNTIKIINLTPKNIIKNLNIKKKISHINFADLRINIIELYILEKNKAKKISILTYKDFLNNKKKITEANWIIECVKHLHVNVFQKKNDIINYKFKKKTLKKTTSIKKILKQHLDYKSIHSLYSEITIADAIYHKISSLNKVTIKNTDMFIKKKDEKIENMKFNSLDMKKYTRSLKISEKNKPTTKH